MHGASSSIRCAESQSPHPYRRADAPRRDPRHTVCPREARTSLPSLFAFRTRSCHAPLTRRAAPHASPLPLPFSSFPFHSHPPHLLQLSYTRGSAIPCVMVVETTDPQALDLLSAPRSLDVRLLRQIATGVGGASGTRLPSLEFERGVYEFATAVWRGDVHGGAARRPAHARVLHGEIHLAPGLKPTCRLGTFELSVSASATTLFSRSTARALG